MPTAPPSLTPPSAVWIRPAHSCLLHPKPSLAGDYEGRGWFWSWPLSSWDTPLLGVPSPPQRLSLGTRKESSGLQGLNTVWEISEGGQLEVPSCLRGRGSGPQKVRVLGVPQRGWGTWGPQRRCWAFPEGAGKAVSTRSSLSEMGFITHPNSLLLGSMVPRKVCTLRTNPCGQEGGRCQGRADAWCPHPVSDAGRCPGPPLSSSPLSRHAAPLTPATRTSALATAAEMGQDCACPSHAL